MTDDLDLLRSELDAFAKPKPKRASFTPREERIIAGFEDILRFIEENGRVPEHGEERDIFERLYAVRLDRLRASQECRDLLADMDAGGVLSRQVEPISAASDEIDTDELLAELGSGVEGGDIRELRHVQTRAEKKAAEEIANREKCPDFDKFEQLLKQVAEDIASGARETRKFELKSEIQQGRFFIVGGQIAYVAERGETFTTDHGRSDARLRVIFDNGTQSEMLMRSLQRSLNADGDAGRRVVEAEAGPLFSSSHEDGDQPSGTIYVLRSKSDHPTVTEHREVLHKIGVTNGKVEKRIAGARLQTTYLMADVEVIATYELFNVNAQKLEKLLHRFFADVALDIEIPDRFGHAVRPREWFLAPLPIIDQVVELVRQRAITKHRYDASTASIVPC
ncbi:GIY-YIG nuclease family protein [Erythrobacter sp.]|uniref:GIY-YIG nuclease family protein n=1 Tax=Erythrobacter sp. TaxID=1042 RepID=UPI003C7480B4